MKGSKIWGVGKHHLWINKEPRWVYVSPEALRKDYNILKANLPIPVGIDHLDEKIIKENKILSKMDLLNVGSIEDVELVDEGIRILEAKITNPLIQDLYNQKKLPSWSIVSKVSLKDCESGKVDFVEDYSIINRVDFVEKGACKTCNLEYTENGLLNAKSVIGDIMAEEGDSNNGTQSNDGSETTLNDVVKLITEFKGEVTENFKKMDDRIEALEGNNARANDAGEDGDNPDGENQNTEDSKIEAALAEINDMKAKAAKNEATGLVNGYIKEGKVLPKQVEQHVTLAMAEPEQYKAMMAESPIIVENLGERFSDGEARGTDGNSDEKLSSYEKDNNVNIEEMCAEDAD